MQSPSEAPEFQATDVSVISEAAFAALISDAPQIVDPLNQPNAPDASEQSPEAPKADDQPRLAALSEPNAPQSAGDSPNISSILERPTTDAQIAAPEFGEQPTTDDIGATLLVPTSRIGDQDRNGFETPDRLVIATPEAPAPRVDSTPAPKPPTDAQKADEVEKATEPDDKATTPVYEAEEKAPDQAASEIVTEAEKRPTTSAPIRSSRPKGRPAKLAEKSQSDNQGPSDIEKALARAQSEAQEAARPAPTGPPLTSSEREGLRLAVRDCWNVNPSSEAARITVTIGLSLDRSGKPIGGTVKYLNATEGSTSAQNTAFETARRAVLRCAKGGYELPMEKYEQWRDLEITFNPEKMRRR